MSWRKWVRASMTVGVWACGTTAAAAQIPDVTPIDSVTLDAAVARALEASPQVIQAVTGLGTAEFATRQAYAGLLPSVSLSSGASLSSSERYSQELGTVITGQSESYSAGLSGSMDLFAGGRNLAAVRSARATVEAAEAAVVTRRFAVALSAKQAFFAVLRAEELMELNAERILQAEQQLEAAQRRLEAGRATRSDVLRAQLQLKNAQQALLESTTQRRTSMYTLGQIVGVAGPVAAVGMENLEPEPLAQAADVLRELVLEQSPAVETAEADMGVAQAGVAQARAQWFPTLGLSGGYNWSNREFGLEAGNTSWNSSLRLSYPLFNGLQREGAVDRAKAQMQVAQAEVASAVRTTLAEFEQLLAALELTELQLALLQESVEVAREDYRVQEERYEHGTATILELVSSQIALTQAEYDLINARYDYQIAKAELESLVGREL